LQRFLLLNARDRIHFLRLAIKHRRFPRSIPPRDPLSVLGHDVSDPDWSLLPKNLPRRVRELLQRCLVKDDKRRLRDIGEARLARILGTLYVVEGLE
jgi:hypothetical protein